MNRLAGKRPLDDTSTPPGTPTSLSGDKKGKKARVSADDMQDDAEYHLKVSHPSLVRHLVLRRIVKLGCCLAEESMRLGICLHMPGAAARLRHWREEGGF